MLRYRCHSQRDDLAFLYLANGESDEIPLTYFELDRQARAIGAWLQEQKLVGKRVLLLYPPGVDFIAAFFGCLYAGSVAVPVYPPRKNRSMLRIQAVAQNANAAIALLPAGKRVALTLVSASGTSECKEKVEAAIRAQGCEVDGFTDVKA